jgi:predicted Co/Zn/Cd cation transporter (cation efflux family)
LEESKKPPENISKHLKQAFILSLPVLIIGVIELFGIDVHDFIAVVVSFLVLLNGVYSIILALFPVLCVWLPLAL